MRQYPISDRFWDPEENFEILNLKNAKNRLSGNARDLWKYSYLYKKNGSLGTHGPKFPLDPPAIISNISLASVVDAIPRFHSV